MSKRRLNELFKRAQTLRPLPVVRGARLKIRFVTQYDTETPTFVFHTNREAELHTSDRRWLENTIRRQWPFTATPLRVVLKAAPPRERKKRKRKRGRDATAVNSERGRG